MYTHPPHLFRHTAAALLALTLGACGGGGGGTGTAPPTVTLNATTGETLAGGKALTLGATASGPATISWRLAPDSPGTLSAVSGGSVSYTPPPAGAVSVNTPVVVTATAGGASAALTLTVYPEPGAPGLYLVAGEVAPTTPDWTLDGPVATMRFREPLALAADLGGNLYVRERHRLTSTRDEGLALRKITPAGMVVALAEPDQVWFGRPDTERKAMAVYSPRSMALDRAGNLFVADYLYGVHVGDASGEGRLIRKITPQGELSVFAGTDAPHTAALTDGGGTAARMLTPELLGVDGADTLYLSDQEGQLTRQLTAAGQVGTIAALPPLLNADLNGNHYRIDTARQVILQTTPAGQTSVIAGDTATPGVRLGALPGAVGNAFGLVRTGPASYAFISGYAVLKLVVPH